jgi:hypothetical protein
MKLILSNTLMKKEDKQLLLVDLCARLPYEIKVLIPELRKDVATLIGIDETCFIVKYDKSIIYCPFNIDIKPYLRPMSSMTEEEKLMYEGLMIGTDNISYMLDVIDWLDAHYFDYRGLIEKDLAIEVTENNNPYK